MSNEIATYSMILSKLSLGKSGTECPTKTQILAINSLIVIDNASTYGANECVKIDDIRKKAETWNYYLTVSPTSMSFGAGGGSKQFTYSSYKRKVLDGVEQSGDISVSLKTSSASGTGFSISGTTVSASVNQTTSSRTGKVTLTQNESNKTATINLSQSADSISSYGEWVITVSANPTSVSSSGGTSTITASAKRAVHWASGKVTEETGNPALSTNLGSLSSSSSPSTLTLGENTSTSSRTATIKATHSGKSATCTVTQAGATPTTTYTFGINPYSVIVGASGGSGSITIRSYKTIGSNTYDVDYSIDSSTLPSWASFNKSNSTFTISSNSSTSSRSAKVYFDQAESGKRDYATLSQDAYVPPADNYVFTWDDGTTTDQSMSLPYQGSNAASDFVVISTKNGSSQSWSVSSKPSWVGTSTSGNTLNVTVDANSGSARNGTIVLTQSGSNKTLEINVSQAAYSATVEWRYKFEFRGGTRDNVSIAIRTMEEYDGASVTFVSYKSKYVDGVEDVSSRQYVDFSIGDYASWATVTKVSSSIANEGKFKFTLSSNFNNRSNRQTFVTVTQNESKKSIICDIMQVGSDAFVASYFVKFRGSTTYPSEINFGLVTAPTSKEFEVESSFEIYTIDSEYNSYDFQFGTVTRAHKVNNFMGFMGDSWFNATYEVGGGSHQYDLLTINAPASDGQNRAVPIYIAQSEFTEVSDWKYREITNSHIFDQIMVKQSGLIIS